MIFVSVLRPVFPFLKYILSLDTTGVSLSVYLLIFRWWPAIICYPEEVPVRIQRLSHQVGEFPVMFFGSRDYCWLHSGRVFGYQEGDKGSKNSEKNHTNRVFQKGISVCCCCVRPGRHSLLKLTVRCSHTFGNLSHPSF